MSDTNSCNLRPECKAIADKLSEAESALHDLIIGRQASVFIDQNGEQVRYTPANKSVLQGYVNDLRNDLNKCQGKTVSSSGPLYFVY